MPEGRDRDRPVTAEMVRQAKENLILRRDTHLDQLADKLQEERVRRVVAPSLDGTQIGTAVNDDDIQYVIDLGLVQRGLAGIEIANPIYREIIPRQLTSIAQINLESQVSPAWFIRPDGGLDTQKLIVSFQEFFRENSEHWLDGFLYREAGPQLLMQAYLQRIANGGGRISREYGLGRGRTDLLLEWPLDKGQGFLGPVQRVVIELKILRKSLEKTMAEGLAQTAAYLDRCLDAEGHLIIFDRRPGLTWEERIWQRQEVYSGREITVWGM